MSKHNILFLGLDTHKVHTQIAYTLDGRTALVEHFGKILSNKTAIKKMVRHFMSKYLDCNLYFVYAAGPCGYFTQPGHECFSAATQPYQLPRY